MDAKPELRARFVLDDDNKPRFLESEQPERKHYSIILETQAPSEVESVVYTLDPTYFDPVREVQRSESPEFAEKITSYGDYCIQIGTSGTKATEFATNRELLSHALRAGHATELDANPEILSAIQNIEKY